MISTCDISWKQDVYPNRALYHDYQYHLNNKNHNKKKTDNFKVKKHKPKYFYRWREDRASWTSVWEGGGPMKRSAPSSSSWVAVSVVVLAGVLISKECKLEKGLFWLEE